MANVLICGSWRHVRADVEQDVRAAVREVMGRGDFLITGGALGVDEWATDEALRIDPSAARLTVVLPTPLDVYAAHLRRRVLEGVVTSARVEPLIDLLERVSAVRPASVVDGPANVCTTETYYNRNSAMNDLADAVWAFQISGSAGTQDQINKARAKGIPVTVREYEG